METTPKEPTPLANVVAFLLDLARKRKEQIGIEEVEKKEDSSEPSSVPVKAVVIG